MKLATLCLLLAAPLLAAQTHSAFLSLPPDPAATTLSAPAFTVHADGLTDDTAALQAAIDHQQQTHNEGVVVIPSGRYRLTRTVYLWPGIRLIGAGPTRPVFLLAPNTTGFNHGLADMLFFAGARPRPSTGQPGNAPRRFVFPPTPPEVVPASTAVPDANPGTFYSAVSNIDFEIGDGNSGAVAIRFHAAQHAFLSHIDFRIGSGFAGVHEVANEAEDLHFHGGQFGIMARKPSPAWQFTLIDSTFDGQRVAGIRENEAGLTLVHDTFRNLPTAVEIDPGYSDWLWIKDARFENISGPAVVLSNELSRLTQINFEGILCAKVPVFARFRESGQTFPQPAPTYRVDAFSHGLDLAYPGAAGVIRTRFDAAPLSTLPPPTPPAIRPLPPTSAWTDVHTLGVTGDGHTDDTAALQRAVDQHPVLYLPTGRYLLSNTLTLQPNSILIGLDPSTTQFDLAENTPAFRGPGSPVPLLLAPAGGNAILSGLGIYTGGLNPRATGLLWHSGSTSLVSDVRFLGGHGTTNPDGSRMNPYNNTHTADPDLHRPWDSQYPSLWIHGGGGTFSNIWTPDTFASAGILIQNTSIPGFVYELSSEHHVRSEIKLDHVANWQLYALQTEEESGESGLATSLEIDHSHDLTIANYHGYRVTHMEQPFPYAVRISDSTGIHFRNVHIDANSSIGLCAPVSPTSPEGSAKLDITCRQAVRSNKVPVEDAIVDQTLHAQVRDREFANLDVSDNQPLPAPPPPPTSTADGALPHLLATGFDNISGAAINASGQLFFVDARPHRIYRWSDSSHNAEVVSDAPLNPVSLIFDKSGDLLVVSSQGFDLTAYALRPAGPQDSSSNFPVSTLEVLHLQPAQPHPGATPVLPVDYWFNGDFANTLSATPPYTYTTLEQMFDRDLSTPRPFEIVSPDGSLFLPTDKPIVQGEPYFGTKWAAILEAYGLVKGTPGQPFYATNEAEQRTYRGTLTPAGALTNIQPFVEQGGESLATDTDGNVYLAAGQVYVYSPAGKLLDTIPVPERPHDILFGGPGRKTLYLLTDHSLYAVPMRHPGN